MANLVHSPVTETEKRGLEAARACCGPVILYRVTPVWFAKNNPDTRKENFDALRALGLYDYEVDPDDVEGLTKTIILVGPSGVTKVSKIRWYRVKKRRDPRFRISNVKEFAAAGDLIAIGVEDGWVTARNLSHFVDGEATDDGRDSEIVPTSGKEGRWVERVHRERERVHGIVNKKKKQAKRAFGALSCEACGTTPSDAFGDSADAAIEAHHLVPLSELPDAGTETTVDDLALLCATCHRLVHALDVSVEDLTALHAGRAKSI